MAKNPSSNSTLEKQLKGAEKHHDSKLGEDSFSGGMRTKVVSGRVDLRHAVIVAVGLQKLDITHRSLSSLVALAFRELARVLIDNNVTEDITTLSAALDIASVLPAFNQREGLDKKGSNVRKLALMQEDKLALDSETSILADALQKSVGK